MAKKKAAPKVSSTIKALFPYKFAEDHINDGLDQVFFLRIHPRNTVILSYSEKVEETRKLKGILDSVDIPFDIFVMDKAESLDAVKAYYEGCRKSRQEYVFAFNDYIKKLETMNADSASIQRAFYLVVRVRDRQRYELFAQQVRGKLDFSLAKRDELEVLMRNYLLHEYVPMPVYSLDRELEKQKRQGTAGQRVHLTQEQQDRYTAMAANESILTAVGSSISEDMQNQAAAAGSATEQTKEGETIVQLVQNENQKREPDGGNGSGRTGGLWPFS